jgi:NodT family efflux transporter outer membrane factor (OMF) lipoprotein
MERTNQPMCNKVAFLPNPVIIILAALFLLGGCAMVGPDYKPPEAPTAKKWKESGKLQTKGEKLQYADWWRVFKDPVLYFLIAKAYEENLPLQVAGIRILEARAQLGIAIGNQFPQLQQLTADLIRTGLSKNAPNSAAADMTYSTLSGGFDASWEIDIWGKYRRAVQSGVANLEASIANYDDVLVTLTAEVARAYVLVRTLEKRLNIARENVKIQKRSLRIADVRFRAGDVSELDVAQAKSLLMNTQSLVPKLEISLRQVKNGLAILLGMLPGELDSVLDKPGPIPTVSANVMLDIPSELLRRRPDIRLAEFQVAAQTARIGVAKADLYPHFALVGSIGLLSSDSLFTKTGGSSGSSLGMIGDSASFTWFAGPALRWDILNYGRIKNRVRVEDARLQQLIVNYENTVLRAYGEVENSLAAFLRGREQARYLGESVKASKRAVDISMIQYRTGLVDFQRVLDTQRFLTLQADLWASSQGEVVASLVAMYKALGGGWQLRKGKGFVTQQTLDVMMKRTDWNELFSPENQQKLAAGYEAGEWLGPDW